MRFYKICIYFVLSMLHGYFWNWRCSKVRIPLLKTFHPIVSYICRNCSKKLLRMCFTYSTRFFFYLSSSDVQFRGFQFDLTLLDPNIFQNYLRFSNLMCQLVYVCDMGLILLIESVGTYNSQNWRQSGIHNHWFETP